MLKKIVMGLALSAMLGVSSLGLASETNNAYILRPGDFVTIEVENKIGCEGYVVGPDGKFSMRLLGQVDVNNKTVEALREELELRFAEYVKAPVVLLNVDETGVMPIYVFGQVKNPGKLEMNAGTTLLDVVSAAGLTNKSAKRRIMLMHAGEEKPYMVVNIQKLLQGRKGAVNPVLKSGDRVYIPGNGKLM